MAIDAMAERAGIRVTRPEAKSQVGCGKMAGEEVILAKPQTFMNLSGGSVRMLLEKYEARRAGNDRALRRSRLCPGASFGFASAAAPAATTG